MLQIALKTLQSVGVQPVESGNPDQFDRSQPSKFPVISNVCLSTGLIIPERQELMAEKTVMGRLSQVHLPTDSIRATRFRMCDQVGHCNGG